MDNKQEVRISRWSLTTLLTSLQLIDIIETVYRGASKGRGLVVSPKGTWRFNCRNHGLTYSLRLFYSIQVLGVGGSVPWPVGQVVLPVVGFPASMEREEHVIQGYIRKREYDNCTTIQNTPIFWRT